MEEEFLGSPQADLLMKVEPSTASPDVEVEEERSPLEQLDLDSVGRARKEPRPMPGTFEEYELDKENINFTFHNTPLRPCDLPRLHEPRVEPFASLSQSKKSGQK
jgi:hypothetical protein